MKKLNKKGFTIIELVIVIAVIAILAGVMIPTFSSIVTKANESAAQQRAMALYKEVYALDLSDGDLDGNEGKNNPIAADDGSKEVDKVKVYLNSGQLTESDKEITEYMVYNLKAASGSYKFQYIGKEYTVSTNDGKEWNVTKTKNDAFVFKSTENNVENDGSEGETGSTTPSAGDEGQNTETE